MNDDRSILRRLEQQGSQVPRVRLPDGDAPSQPDAAKDERYEIVGEIARGGVGVVYRGRDTDLCRDVAMKVLRDEFLDSPELVQRFVEEAQIGGQLQHPGIVPVYELGMREKSRPYFSMKLVKGRTLSELLAERASPADGRHELLAHFAQACHTVAYAHSRGVIHRDLKPSNVMVGAFGEVQVVDWGFAKVLRRGGVDDERRARREVTVVATVRTAAEGSASVAGQVMGTPAYMPPEQALGHVDDLTERADVFALGAVLCEILTGRPPYTGAFQEVLTAAAHAHLEDAHARLDACEGDLELVALAKACLRPLPMDRPRSARDVAEALGSYLSGAERRAHEARVRAVEERVKVEEQRRARRQTLTVAAAVLLVVLLAGGGWFAKGRIDAARERERTAAFRAAVREATRLQSAGDDWPGARAAADRALGLAGIDEKLRGEAEELRAGVDAAADALEQASQKAKREADLLAALDEIALRQTPPPDEAYRAALPDFDALQDFDRREELAAHFDHWSQLRNDGEGQAIRAMARSLDPNEWRNEVREAANDVDRLRAIATHDATAARDARSLDLLATTLAEAGDEATAAGLLRRAADRYPDNFWIQFHLGRVTAQVDEAVEHLTAAAALRPTSLGAVEHLGAALVRQGRFDRAVALYRDALRVAPSDVGVKRALAEAERRAAEAR